jgi:hypothetical protein
VDPQFDQALDVAALLLRAEAHPPSDLIRTKVRQALGMFASELNSREDELVRILESRLNVRIGAVNELFNNSNHLAWLPGKRSQIEWKYWDRYSTYLSRDKGWSPEVVDRLNECTDKALGFLEDPARPGAWDRRGLVVGHVQSGKTSNYTGLICKAADAGYKLIVVLAGVHNSLRSQTQLRLDEGFLGFDSLELQKPGPKTPIGVSRVDRSCEIPNTITNRSEKGDFSTAVARQFMISPGGKPLLFVVKKNPTVLKNLLNWVMWAAPDKDERTGRPIVTSIPLLIIDDEADFASVDTRAIPRDENGLPALDHDPTTINRGIRQLLHSFEKAAYVGYTATPFANVYIHDGAYTTQHGMDLFPRAFIINLPAPSNHIGPARLFGLDASTEASQLEQDGLPIVRRVEDFQQWMPDGHRKDHVPGSLPSSLREAIRAFLISCAARMARGQGDQHCSMLIHVTRFTDVQGHVAKDVKEELKTLVRRLRLGDGKSGQLLSELKQLWDSDFVPTSSAIDEKDCDQVDWSAVSENLFDAASKIEVRAINGSAGDVLDYAENQAGLSVIAIGGDKLSRGLTLEGLSVSYYLRASRMYDTLMQMGRWFGYRPGYLDLCRLYTTHELVEWYEHITMANEEVRELFDTMSAAGANPEDFGIRIRSHPDLLVTGAVKMRNGHTMQLSFSGDISETIGFHRDGETVAKNLKAAEHFLTRLGSHESVSDRSKATLLWRNVPGQEIVDHFLPFMTVHPFAKKVRCELLRKYISQRLQAGELVEWTVALVSSSDGKAAKIGDLPVGLVTRGPHPKEVLPSHLGRYCVRRLVSPTDEMIDLTAEQRALALEATRQNWRDGMSRSVKEPSVPSGIQVRQARDSGRGLLLIYPLSPVYQQTDPKPEQIELVDSELPVIGFAISFPGSKLQETVGYVVNNVYFEQEFIEDDD